MLTVTTDRISHMPHIVPWAVGNASVGDSSACRAEGQKAVRSQTCIERPKSCIWVVAQMRRVNGLVSWLAFEVGCLFEGVIPKRLADLDFVGAGVIDPDGVTDVCQDVGQVCVLK